MEYTDEYFMELALKEAQKAKDNDEVPIGAVLVIDNKVIAKGHNNRNKSQNAVNHAEIIAITKACKKLKSWRLENAKIYVTLEPCPMCAGAIANARIQTLIYGASSDNLDTLNLTELILSDKRLNHKVQIKKDVLKDKCSQLISKFFKSKR